MKTAMQSKTALKVSRIAEKTPEKLSDILNTVDVLHISKITEHTISYQGQNKAVEKKLRAFLKHRVDFGKVRYNANNDITSIMFKVGK